MKITQKYLRDKAKEIKFELELAKLTDNDDIELLLKRSFLLGKLMACKELIEDCVVDETD